MLARKYPPRRMSLVERHHASRASNETRRDIAKRFLHILINFVTLGLIEPDDDIVLLTVDEIFRRLYYVKQPQQFPIRHTRRTIDSFREGECYQFFRFQKVDLLRLKKALKIPDYIYANNRSSFGGEEVMLFSLHRYAQGGGNLEHDATFIFGREFSQWSRAFQWFNRHIIENFTDLMVNNFEYWLPHFPMFAEKIRLKTEQMVNN